MTKDELRRYLDENRKGLLDSIAHLTEEQMCRRVEPGEWSVAEILAHLPVAERHILGQAMAVHSAGAESMAFLTPEKRHESAARAHEMAPPQMVNDMMDARRQTLTFLDSLAEADLDKSASNAEYGTLTLGQIIGAISYHERDHRRQIQRLREKIEAESAD